VSEATTPGAPVVVSVRPEPEPAVLAAIMAAVDEAWPRPGPVADDVGRSRPTTWRFSGRWWAQPIATGRRRPRLGP